MIWAIDTLKIEQRVSGRCFPTPNFSFAPITIDIQAHPLGASLDNIQAAGRDAKAVLRRAIQKIERRIGRGTVALFGHLEASNPCRGDKLAEYLFKNPKPDTLYTTIHFHGWIFAAATASQLRQDLVRVISGSRHEPRRVCFRERHYETQDLATSISEYLDDGAKHKHSVVDEGYSADVGTWFAVARFRKHLRGDGLRGSRLAVNLTGMKTTLDTAWKQCKSDIFSFLEEIEQDRRLPVTPDYVRFEYEEWKAQKLLTAIADATFRNRGSIVFLYNWFLPSPAKLLGHYRLVLHGTVCGGLRPRCDSHQPRAPPFKSFEAGTFHREAADTPVIRARRRL